MVTVMGCLNLLKGSLAAEGKKLIILFPITATPLSLFINESIAN